MGSEVGTVLDGQTFDFFPPRDRWVEPVPTRSREIENSPQLEYTPAPGFEPGSPDWEAGMLSTTPPCAELNVVYISYCHYISVIMQLKPYIFTFHVIITKLNYICCNFSVRHISLVHIG